MKNIYYFSFLVLIYLLSCETKNFDNPLDPAGENYVSPKPIMTRGVIVTDFENGLHLSVWNKWHGVESRNPPNKIQMEIIKDNSIGFDSENHVMKLEYDVSDNSNSYAFWYQRLGYASKDIGTFNAVTMDLRKLTFYAKGEKGGEKFSITLTDSSENYTDPGFMITVQNFWIKYEINLTELEIGGVDLKNLIYFDIYFDYNYSPQIGKIYVDEFAFEWD